MSDENSQVQGHDYREEAQALREELEQLKVNNQVVWELLIQIGNRLQRSTTSIKTAVSSLLEYEIFWDEKTQHEFLEVIDSSTDEMAVLIILATLAFRSQAKTLEIESETQSLQEILVSLKNSVEKDGAGTEVILQYPSEGAPAVVDFQYFSLALRLLIEVISSKNNDVTNIILLAREYGGFWHLRIDQLSPSIATIIYHFCNRAQDIATINRQLLPENALKLMTACRILYLQRIQVTQAEVVGDTASICLLIPTAPITA